MKPLPQVVLYHIVDLSDPGLQLDDGDVVSGGSIPHHVFYIAGYSVTNLPLEVLKTERVQSMELNELLIVRNLEADSSPDGHGYAKSGKRGLEHIEKGTPNLTWIICARLMK